jgi:hypothetical protein
MHTRRKNMRVCREVAQRPLEATIVDQGPGPRSYAKNERAAMAAIAALFTRHQRDARMGVGLAG